LEPVTRSHTIAGTTPYTAVSAGKLNAVAGGDELYVAVRSFLFLQVTPLLRLTEG
jgi:hypothetical protein